MKRYLGILLVLIWTHLVWTHLAWTPLARAAAAPRMLYRIETVAGSSGIGDGGPATSAPMANIQGVVADRRGNLDFSDTAHQRIRNISRTASLTPPAGTANAGCSGHGGPAEAAPQ